MLLGASKILFATCHIAAKAIHVYIRRIFLEDYIIHKSTVCNNNKNKSTGN